MAIGGTVSDQGVRMEIVDILLDIEPDTDPETLDENTSLSRDLGMDGTEKRSMAAQINQRFDVAMTESECEEIDTIKGLVSYVESHIR